MALAKDKLADVRRDVIAAVTVLVGALVIAAVAHLSFLTAVARNLGYVVAFLFQAAIGAVVLAVVYVGGVAVWAMLKAPGELHAEVSEQLQISEHQVDALATELQGWRPDGKAGELKARLYRERPDLTIAEADQVWPFLWAIYQKPHTNVHLMPDESNSSGRCIGTISLLPISTYTISRPCANATMLALGLEQMVTNVKNEAHEDARR